VEFAGGLRADDWFTAHPKVVDGVMYAFGYHLERPPYASFYRIGADGMQTGEGSLAGERSCL
jgi:carotenoid cleavage dioxygenase-like enzyme